MYGGRVVSNIIVIVLWFWSIMEKNGPISKHKKNFNNTDSFWSWWKWNSLGKYQQCWRRYLIPVFYEINNIGPELQKHYKYPEETNHGTIHIISPLSVNISNVMSVKAKLDDMVICSIQNNYSIVVGTTSNYYPPQQTHFIDT